MFERLASRRQPLEGLDGKAAGRTWVEEKLSPSPLLANAATALAPFALPKLGRAAIQFWTLKPSMGDLPTTAAVALQLHALPAYERWRAFSRPPVRTVSTRCRRAPGTSASPTRCGR